jgi:type I site-specific restriction endonuclease
MNEAETRAEHIDPALKAAGWGVVEGSRIRREYPITLGRIEGHGKRGKALTADYLLEYRDSIPDAVADLGQTPLEIGQAFAGFQKYLYQQQMTV